MKRGFGANAIPAKFRSTVPEGMEREGCEGHLSTVRLHLELGDVDKIWGFPNFGSLIG